MDTTQINPNANYFSSGATFDTSKPISTATLASNETPLNVAPVPQDTTDYKAVTSSVPDYQSIIDKYNQPTTQETAITDNQSWIQKQLAKITGMGGSVGQNGQIDTTMAQNTANEKALQQFGYQGSNDAYKQLTDVTNQINALKKEALAIPLQLQEQVKGRGVTAGGLQPIQTGQLRENAIKSLGLSSIAETIQGNISTASSLAEKAVNMQFAPLQAELDAQMFNYQQNKDALERADKKKADMLNFSIQERSRQLDNQREDKKTVLGFAAEAAKNGAPTLLLTRAQGLNDPAQALSLLGQYMSDPMAKQQALADLEFKRASTAKIYEDMKKTEAEKQKILSETVANNVTAKTQLQNNQALALAKELKKSDAVGKSSAVGASVAKLVPFGQSLGLQGDRSAFEAKVTSLKSNLTLDNLKLLKGSMSDKDLIFLNSIGSSLDTNMSEKEFDAELDKVIKKLEAAGATTGTEQTTVTSNGSQYIVGQVYNDGTANWTVDASGKWTKQ